MPDSDAALVAEQTWRELSTRLSAEEPRLLHRLPPGATEPELLAIEQAVGVPLPPLVAAIYRVHNGIGLPAFEEYQGELCAARSYFYSLSDALVAWNLLGECLRDGAFANFVVDRADHGVRADWWNPHWLPIAGDQAGNYSCLDLAPALGGTPGQVIGFWHEDSDRCIDAPDLASFLLDHVDERDWGADIRAALAIN